ncbi:hypothetical protein KY312_03920 [Candidatus Woesearchaeota archaeon]|nr:hypothetical protein [Candidatus Woesearchaeota archaeon]
MHKKRGQVTVFIVIGLFLILFAALLLYIRNVQRTSEIEKEAQQITHFSTAALKVKPYVTDCIEKQATIAIILAAQYAGEENINLPSIGILEESISKYVNDNIILCTHFAIFKEFNVTPGKINTSVHVYSNNVVIDVNWPLRLVQKDLTLYEKDFRVTFELKLSELYQKVRAVAWHNTTLDLDYILNQKLDIEVIGCEDDSIRYMVNDRDYLLDENVLRFFFRTGMENLSKLFEFENGIRYLPYSMPGRHTLKLTGENKTISFEITNNSYINGCFETAERFDYHTYSIVKQNTIPVSITAENPIEIEIVETEPITDEDKTLLYSYQIKTNEIDDSNPAILTFYHNYAYVIPKIYIFDNGWKEIESMQNGNYVLANIAETGIYAVGTPICAHLNKGEGLNIAFVPVDYENLSEFTRHADNYTQTLLSVNPINEYQDKFNIYHIIKPNNLSCLSFQSEKCSPFLIEQETLICEQKPDYIVALIDNSLVGLDHKTEDWISYIGSYLTLDARYCSACNFIREFGHYMGLADEFAYLGNTTQVSEYPNCDNEFSGNEKTPCAKWQDIPGTGCYPGCMYDNWYRPTKGFVLTEEPRNETINFSHSIMRGDIIDGQKLLIKKIFFGSVSENYLRSKIEQW